MRFLLASLVLLVLLGSACAQSEAEVSCEGFKTYYAGLSCTGGLELELDCGQYREYTCDAREYFTCLEDQFFCDDDGNYVEIGFGPCAALADC